MLDIDRCININACPQEFFHVLIPFSITASCRIAVC